MKRRAVRQTLTKELAQLDTAAMRMRTLRAQIGAIMITSQGIAVMITGRRGTIHNIIKLIMRNVVQLKILTGRI